MAKLLITGGAGFIGSHTCILLIEEGHDLIVIDSFVNSSHKSLERVNKICGIEDRNKSKRITIIKGDIRDRKLLLEVFSKNKEEGKPIEAVIHFAGLKSVAESIKFPLAYWDVNINGSCNLLAAMSESDCKTLVFSSSATIYGPSKDQPLSESSPLNPINPYGQTKAAVERMLFDVFQSNNNWKIACLRYFNPVGAHPSGLLGEDPEGIPNNLFPLITKILPNNLNPLKVFGGDWPTIDGSGVRDYIHVMDLAKGHISALNYLILRKPKFLTLNLGSGKGYSVFQVIDAFEKVSQKKITYEIVDRRDGDVAVSIADIQKAQSILNWKTEYSLIDSCKHSWRWQTKNPNGYS